MSYAFAGATSFDKTLSWNTSRVTTMKGMFSGASSFNGDIDAFDVSNVVDFSEMVRIAI
jgi:surface protein